MEELVHLIIAGKNEEESDSDILALCFLATLIVSHVEEADMEESLPEDVPPADQRDSCFRARLRRLGEILCPLGDDVKHDKRDYVAGMVQARLDYRGIAISSSLQAEFQSRIYSLALEGHLDSLERAIEASVDKALRRQQRLRAQ